ncbi:MAG: hypothetical protein ACXV95_13610 [Acidimicrobiales bacterium]
MPSRSADHHPEPAAVAGGTPLIEITDDLARQGRDGQFQALEGGVLRCLTCDHRFPAEDASTEEVSRLEGASDPADLAIVVPLQCPRCGTHSALIANYGPEASAAEAEVLTALPRRARLPATGAETGPAPTAGGEDDGAGPATPGDG